MSGVDPTGYTAEDPTGTKEANDAANNEKGKSKCFYSASKTSCSTADDRIQNGEENDRKLKATKPSTGQVRWNLQLYIPVI